MLFWLGAAAAVRAALDHFGVASAGQELPKLQRPFEWTLKLTKRRGRRRKRRRKQPSATRSACFARTLTAAEGRPLGAVAPPTEKPEPADWVASAGVAQIAATAASELAELHAWLGRDPLKTEKDWDPVAL